MRQTLALDRREHFIRILQHAGAADDPTGRHIDADVEAAEVVVELRRPEIEVGVPAAQIVVLGDARKPLRRLEETIFESLCHPMVASVGTAGQLGMPVDGQRRVGPGRDRSREIDRCQRRLQTADAELTRRCRASTRTATATPATTTVCGRRGQVDRFAIDHEPGDDAAVGVFSRRPRRRARDQAAIHVVIEPQHDLLQLLRAVVVQRNRLAASERACRRIQAHLNGVVVLELPVVRPGPAGPVARAGLKGAANGVGHRHIAANRARRFGRRARHGLERRPWCRRRRWGLCLSQHRSSIKQRAGGAYE